MIKVSRQYYSTNKYIRLSIARLQYPRKEQYAYFFFPHPTVSFYFALVKTSLYSFLFFWAQQAHGNL